MEERNITTTTAATESQAITTNAGTQEAAISDERIPGKLIGAIVAVGSLAFIGILTETVMTVLFPQLMREFNVDTRNRAVDHHHLPAGGRGHHAVVVVS